MIVVEASTIVEVLFGTAAGSAIRARLEAAGESLHAPHVLDLEVLHVLRRSALAGESDPNRYLEAIEYFGRLPLTRHPHAPYLSRIWELRHIVTAYDAAYVSLAEALECPLLTHDRRLSESSGHSAEIEFI